METIIDSLAATIANDDWKRYLIYSAGTLIAAAVAAAIFGGILLVLSAVKVPIPGLNSISHYIPRWEEGVGGGLITFSGFVTLVVTGVVAYDIKKKANDKEINQWIYNEDTADEKQEDTLSNSLTSNSILSFSDSELYSSKKNELRDLLDN